MFESGMAIFRDLDEPFWAAVTAANLAEVRAELGMPDEAEPLVRQALDLFVARGDRGGEGNALRILSLIARQRGELERAQEHIDRAVAIAREHQNAVWEGYWLLELGMVHLARGNAPDALVALRRSAQLHRELGDRAREAQAWNATGRAYREMGRPEEAIEFHRRAAAVHNELGDQWRLGVALGDLAIAQHLAGEVDAAVENGRRALEILASYEDPQTRSVRSRVAELLGEAS